MIPNLTFRIFFSIFAIFFLVQRYVEAKYHKRLQGKKQATWLTKSLIAAHFLFFFGSLIEVYGIMRNTFNFSLSILGFVLFFMAFFLRQWVIRTLGPFWSIEIEMRDQHKLITTGPFQFCRHPNYLAIILEVIGFCLVANAFVTLIISLLIYIPLLLVRIKLEEKELIRMFGSIYKVYMNKTPAILPFLKRDINASFR